MKVKTIFAPSLLTIIEALNRSKSAREKGRIIHLKHLIYPQNKETYWTGIYHGFASSRCPIFPEYLNGQGDWIKNTV